MFERDAFKVKNTIVHNITYSLNTLLPIHTHSHFYIIFKTAVHMVYILFLIKNLFVIIVAPGPCKNEDLRGSFNSTGWLKCPSTFPYIKGMYRRKQNSNKNQDKIHNLKGARCCEGFENISECVEVDWATSFDR